MSKHWTHERRRTNEHSSHCKRRIHMVWARYPTSNTHIYVNYLFIRCVSTSTSASLNRKVHCFKLKVSQSKWNTFLTDASFKSANNSFTRERYTDYLYFVSSTFTVSTHLHLFTVSIHCVYSSSSIHLHLSNCICQFVSYGQWIMHSICSLSLYSIKV